MQQDVSGSGEPLVLVPGGLTGWLSWIPHAEILSKSCKVIRLQLHSVALGLSGLVKRMDRMRVAARRVQKRCPQVQIRYREQLMERIQNAGIEAAKIEEERVLKEIIFFADRSDISEEITRLQSHFKQFDDCVNSREPVGRTLDFLAQEMNREINTIGSKANDAMISREVVVLKTELEKFREQAQNVE
jgi:uncharacterized protein (TIGR00255 family)